MDISISHFGVAAEIGAAHMCESDSKLNEEAFEFINSARRVCEEELYLEAISGEVMIKELVEVVRQVEMATPKKNGV